METSIAGRPATYLVITIPAHGAWYLDVGLSGTQDITGTITSKVADLSLVGTVIHRGDFNVRTDLRIVGGRGGLAKVLPPRAYHDDAGVRVATVIRDAMREAGEILDESTLPTTRLGPHYTRPEAPASSVLNRHAREAWYVAENGTVRLGARPSGVLPAGVAIQRADKARGRVDLASSSVATILPGVVAEGLVVTDVRHEVDGDSGLRTVLWGRPGGGASRRLVGWRRLLEALDPDRKFRGVVEYRVVTREGARLNLQPVRSGLGMPELRRVPSWPGVPGCEGDVVPGSRVLVGFIDSDPSRPYVAAYEGSEGAGFVPTALRIGGSGPAASRVGDSVSISREALNAAAGSVVLGTVVFASGASGTITSGSSKVQIG